MILKLTIFMPSFDAAVAEIRDNPTGGCTASARFQPPDSRQAGEPGCVQSHNRPSRSAQPVEPRRLEFSNS